tara:strand:- start:738 stop:1181 length:444 start_codon:yes stop_codon:yes gene_type:complete
LNISQEGLALIKKFEGCELKSYRCSAEVLTIGYGHTKGVEEGQEITQEEAEEMLSSELDEYEGYINDMVECELEQHQFDALVAWVYNLGPSNLKSSTLLKRLNSNELKDVPNQLKRWNKAGGKILQGLVRRRKSESLLFEGKDWRDV